MPRIHISLTVLSTLLLATACGGVEELPSEGPMPALEAASAEGNVQAFSACTVTLNCADSSTLQCSSPSGNCQSTATSVTCDGVPHLCRPCAPLAQTIRENIPVCYPSRHPFGRYALSGSESGVTYTWSSNYADLHSTTGTNVILSATSVGYFTLWVTATRAGCPDTTTFSADFYAEDCGS